MTQSVELERSNSQKQRAAATSLFTNASLTTFKFAAALLTGSVSLLSEAAHSATDVVASALSYASVKAAAAPPDEEHPYGHGKIESLAGFGEAVLLLVVVGYIVVHSVPRFSHPRPVKFAELGLAVMSISSLTSLAISLYVSRIGKVYQSVALKTNGQHLAVDAWTSAGVVLALLLTHYVGWQTADPSVACVMAIVIARSAWRLAKEAFDQLIDRRISDDEIAEILRLVGEEHEVLSFHGLRSRHSGSVHIVEMHVVVPREWSVVQAHELADRIEEKIETALAPAHVVIHVDPFDPSKVT